MPSPGRNAYGWLASTSARAFAADAANGWSKQNRVDASVKPVHRQSCRECGAEVLTQRAGAVYECDHCARQVAAE